MSGLAYAKSHACAFDCVAKDGLQSVGNNFPAPRGVFAASQVTVPVAIVPETAASGGEFDPERFKTHT